MPETHFNSQPTMPKSAPKSLKAPTFIQSIRSTFSLRRRLGCSSASSSATSIRASASCRPRTQANPTTNINNNSNNSKNFMMSKQRNVLFVATRNKRHHHRQHQFVDSESPHVTPNSPAVSESESSLENSASSRSSSPVATTVALDIDSVLKIPHLGTEVFRTSRQRRAPHPSPEELAEHMQNWMRRPNMLNGSSDSHDQFRDWRLDTDDMTYEQLLALGDKIGYVSTGLNESAILRCVKKNKFSGNSLQLPDESELKCSICQEEYESKDKLGMLKCAHSYHRDCIKRWLRHKKICPVCKVEVKAWCLNDHGV